MKMQNKPPVFDSIPALHRALGLPSPLHPLVSLVDYSKITASTTELEQGMVFNFYKVSYKKYFSGRIKYGQQHYDFDEGGLSFVAPGQLIKALEAEADYSGYTLLLHPDFLQQHPLGSQISHYGFFSYAANEALHLSEKEKQTIIHVFEAIAAELDNNIDQFSQELLLSQITTLLNYSKRFYGRQFITRQSGGNDLLARFEQLLATYFETDKPLHNGLPAVEDLAASLHVSAHYLSDMLRTLTAKNTQQHIHSKIIEKAKVLLSTTPLSVAEIAYQLGFEHPQSFNRLFRKKTNLSPLAYRESFN